MPNNESKGTPVKLQVNLDDDNVEMFQKFKNKHGKSFFVNEAIRRFAQTAEGQMFLKPEYTQGKKPVETPKAQEVQKEKSKKEVDTTEETSKTDLPEPEPKIVQW